MTKINSTGKIQNLIQSNTTLGLMETTRKSFAGYGGPEGGEVVCQTSRNIKRCRKDINNQVYSTAWWSPPNYCALCTETHGHRKFQVFNCEIFHEPFWKFSRPDFEIFIDRLVYTKKKLCIWQTSLNKRWESLDVNVLNNLEL